MGYSGMTMFISFFKDVWTYRVVRWGLAAMFLTAGIIKLSDVDTFAGVIAAFGLAPKPLVPFIALGLPIIEILAALGLVFDVKGTLSILTGLTVFFIFVLGYGLYMGLDVDCGCYGPGDPEGETFASLRTSFYRDWFMLVGFSFLYWWRWVHSARPKWFSAEMIKN